MSYRYVALHPPTSTTPGEIYQYGVVEAFELVESVSLAYPGCVVVSAVPPVGDVYWSYTYPVGWVVRPEKPASYYAWDYNAKQWYDARTLQGRRDAQWELIKQERNSREYGGFVWDGSTFDSDSESQRRIMGAVQMAVLAKQGGTAFLRTWTLKDNTTRDLDADQMLAVGMALGAHVGTLFDIGTFLRDKISTSPNPEDVVWPT